MRSKQSETGTDDSAFTDVPVSSGRIPANAPRRAAHLGTNLHIKGKIDGEEDLRIDGKVDGSVSLTGHDLIVGHSAQLTSDVIVREVIVCGHVSGDLRGERVDIKRDGHVTGNVTTARITIEDGAHFNGRIIRTGVKKPSDQMEQNMEGVSVGGSVPDLVEK